MFKAIGLVQLSLAPIFVIPAMTGQEGMQSSLDAQLEATKQSIEYLGGLRVSVAAGDPGALRALERATEAPRDASPQRAAHLEVLQDDIARLRFSLDRLLADPSEVAAITSLPRSVVKTLGLAGSVSPEAGSTLNADGTVSTPTSPAPTIDANGNPIIPEDAPVRTKVAVTNPAAARPEQLAGMGNTAGMTDMMRAAVKGDVGPLDTVSQASRRRGNEPISLEGDGYVADPVALGRLLVRSGRTAEAIEVLQRHPDLVGARYWLARSYQNQDRFEEALEIFRVIKDDPKAGAYSGYSAQDVEFLEFRQSLTARRR